MDQKIIVFAGKKQSGKTSAANFVAGYTMSQLARSGFEYLPEYFTIDEDGHLVISTTITDAQGNTKLDYGVLDLTRKDFEFIKWASNCLWPYVKVYAYADMLKMVANLIFDIPYELMNGSDKDKKQLTHIKWKNMCRLLPPAYVSQIKKSEKYNKKMKVRDFLQYFGTEVCRHLYSECWTNACFKDIESDQSNLAIISDARFRNEVMAAKKYNAKIVKLERAPSYDIHESENELDKMHKNNFDLIIPKDVSLKEKNNRILDKMYEWGWFSTHIELQSV